MSSLDYIQHLEYEASSLEPGTNERERISSAVRKLTEAFLEQVDESPAYQQDSEAIQLLEEPFADESMPQDEVFHRIVTAVDGPGINPASGNHLGYIPGGGIYTSALADYWADVTNRYAGVFFANPGAVKMENELIRWLLALVGFPLSGWGNLASGGSIANLTAIVAARDARQITPDKIEKSVIYVSSQTHHCVAKAIQIAGLASCQVRQIPLTPQLTMDTNALQETIQADQNQGLQPFLLVSSAGTTDAGVIDPIGRIDKICKTHSIWHHVDAAYGGFFLLLEKPLEKLQQMSTVDSIVLDPHKSLFLPYGLGIVLVRDIAHLYRSFSYAANYMQDARSIDNEPSPADVGLELTKHFRGLRMWLPLKLHGLRPFKSALKEKMLLARYFYEEIQKVEGFEAFREPELSVVMFRYTQCEDKEAFNQSLIQRIHEDGRVFVSSTTVNGEIWIRVAILVFRTHLKNIRLSLSVISENTRALCEIKPLPS